MTKEKEKYRTIPDIDQISIQYTRLYDYIKDDCNYIKVYMSIYFYDSTANNLIQEKNEWEGMEELKEIKEFTEYMSEEMYDNVKESFPELFFENKDKYWNDIWIVTYKENKIDNSISLNCDNCGAPMKFSSKRNILKCEYCGGSKYFNEKYSNWTVDDIEVRR